MVKSESQHVRDLFDLQGQVALVSGGSRGLGLEIAEGLAEAGASVVVTGRREPWLSEAQESLRAVSEKTRAIQCDAKEEADARSVVNETESAYGSIDILVNAAGISWGAPSLEMPLQKWNDVMQVNAAGTFLFCQIVGRGMVERGYGRIINVGSISGVIAPIVDLGAVGYAASKGAVTSLSRALAVEWAAFGITVNTLAPGYFRTRMSNAYLDEHEEEVLRVLPMGRVGAQGELKGAALFLASRASSYLTGQVIAVDGGLTAT